MRFFIQRLKYLFSNLQFLFSKIKFYSVHPFSNFIQQFLLTTWAADDFGAFSSHMTNPLRQHGGKTRAHDC